MSTKYRTSAEVPLTTLIKRHAAASDTRTPPTAVPSAVDALEETK